MPRRGESIFKRKDGRWEARYIHHYENGKAKYKYLYARSYTEVRQKRITDQAVAKDDQRSTKTADNFARLSDLAKMWLMNVKKGVKESTYTRYVRTVDKYLMDFLSGTNVASVNTQLIIELRDKLLERGGRNGRPLSAKTVSDVLCVLKGILGFSKEIGYPCCDFMSIQYPKKVQTKTSVLSVRDQYNLEKKLFMDCGVSSTGVLLGLFTGMRIGELCGLKRKDFDFDAKTVTVSRSVGRISDLDSNTAAKTKVTISTPKTNSGIRQIPLPEFLAERMKNYCQDIQNEHYILSKEEAPMEPHQLYGRYKTLLKKAGIKGNYKFHTLRHTFATRCVEKGFDIKSLSEILGHANINITLSTYVHPSMEQKRSQMELLTPLYCEDAIV